mmetsp:Transcript_18493/g.47339  ORF Transcript_18493/g.47339 Transcript_18493/m.47339 type:complete len:403 (+) Transcript_18493:322-1530(+)
MAWCSFSLCPFPRHGDLDFLAHEFPVGARLVDVEDVAAHGLLADVAVLGDAGGHDVGDEVQRELVLPAQQQHAGRLVVAALARVAVVAPPHGRVVDGGAVRGDADREVGKGEHRGRVGGEGGRLGAVRARLVAHRGHGAVVRRPCRGDQQVAARQRRAHRLADVKRLELELVQPEHPRLHDEPLPADAVHVEVPRLAHLLQQLLHRHHVHRHHAGAQLLDRHGRGPDGLVVGGALVAGGGVAFVVTLLAAHRGRHRVRRVGLDAEQRPRLLQRVVQRFPLWAGAVAGGLAPLLGVALGGHVPLLPRQPVLQPHQHLLLRRLPQLHHRLRQLLGRLGVPLPEVPLQQLHLLRRRPPAGPENVLHQHLLLPLLPRGRRQAGEPRRQRHARLAQRLAALHAAQRR